MTRGEEGRPGRETFQDGGNVGLGAKDIIRNLLYWVHEYYISCMYWVDMPTAPYIYMYL